MGKKSSLNAAVRYLLMLRLLSRRRSWGTADLQEALAEHGFEVSRRTIQRDLRDLQTLFPGLKSFGTRTQLTWRWDHQAPVMDIPGWDINLTAAMKLVETHLKTLLPPQVLEDLKPYFDKADHLLAQSATQLKHWQDKVAVFSRTMPRLPPQVDDQILTTLYTAVLNEQPVSMTYRNRDNAIHEALFSPAGLVIQDQVIYVVGCYWQYDDIRHVALHRIQQAQLVARHDYHLPDGFDFQQYLQTSPFYLPVSSEPVALRLRMERYTARHLQESPLSKDQKIYNLPQAPDEVIITATVANTQQLRWWLLGLGSSVEVLEPLSLREALQSEIAKMHQRYQENTP